MVNALGSDSGDLVRVEYLSLAPTSSITLAPVLLALTCTLILPFP